MAKRKHLLLTVLGTAPKPACYALGDRRAEARLAPVALMELLPPEDRPDHVLALCTAQAMHGSWPLLEQALGAGCSTAAVEVPAGETQTDVDTFLSKVTTAITGNVDLTVDVTHGYRHFSFLTYVAVLYLAALRRVSVRGAYYGLLRPDPSGVNQDRSEASSSPSEGADAARNVTEATFLDLRPLLALPRWLHALQVLGDTGSTTPMAEVLCDGSRNQSAGKIARELSRISEGYLSGLPVELGRETHLFRKRSLRELKKLLRREHHLPLAGELVDRLDELLEPFALTAPVDGDGWKRHVVLSDDELKRQARVIDDLWRRDNIGTALGLMNEWTVSWAVWRIGGGNGWLDRQVRCKVSHRLHAIAAVGRDSGVAGVLTNEQRALGSFWEELCELRNAYHHHGMRRGVVVSEGGKVRKQLDGIRGFWERTLRSCPDVSLSLGESHGGPVLVSPIGRRPGVLFSALHACRAAGDGSDPAVCLVVCSSETEGLIAETVSHAEYSGPVEPLRLEDPYGGRPEIDQVVKATRARFVGAGEVFVNVTGGTTLMGLVAEALADAARRLACPVRRFGLIDRRPPAQQDAEPYRAGDPFWLDSAKDDDDD